MTASRENVMAGPLRCAAPLMSLYSLLRVFGT
jgi:hypothetical protein